MFRRWVWYRSWPRASANLQNLPQGERLAAARARRPGRRPRSALFPTNAASHRSTRKILWKATISRAVGSVYVAPVPRAGQARACTYSVGLKADATKTFRAWAVTQTL